jgi:putative two-component system response regulator
MLIEDNPTDIGPLVEAIGDDYDLCVHTCGEKALEAVETVQPDLILLDVTLPGLDGFEIFKRLTTNKATINEAVRKIVDGRDGIRPEMYCPTVLAAFLQCQQEISTA